MSLEKDLAARAENKCELCSSQDNLAAYKVEPAKDNSTSDHVYLCKKCISQINGDAEIEINHWRCLNESMWSVEPTVQVLAWRMLNKLKAEDWALGLLDMLYLDEETEAWAKEGAEDDDENAVVHKDSNGAKLENGDSVVLIKDLNVKGAGFTAKRGTAVRNIRLVHDNAEHIEGKVDGQQIVILTKYVKK
jgi:protein PhnA